MLIFPAVDIKAGRCVRLIQGNQDQETVYGQDPGEMARKWESQGAQWVHVVDLDGAFSGVPRNREVIAAMVAQLSVPVQLGGGIRDLETARSYLEIGIRRVIVGTRALQDHNFVREMIAEFGAERVVVGIDARDGMVAVKGWVDISTIPALEMAMDMKALGVQRLVYTDISRDGLLQGPNLKSTQELAGSGLAIIASGGVANLSDIEKLAQIPGVEGVIVGKALYEGRFNLVDALRAADN